MPGKIIFMLVFLIIPIREFFPNENNTQDSSSVSFAPQIRCIQFEGTTALLAAVEYGLLFDFDLLKIKSKDDLTIGIRSGVERYAAVEYGGPTGGSPFTDYYSMLRLTEEVRGMSITLSAGYSYHTTSEPFYYKSKYNIRGGFEFRYIIIDYVLAVIIKSNTSFMDNTSSGGIGLAFGFCR